jgi:hypothetical protein
MTATTNDRATLSEGMMEEMKRLDRDLRDASRMLGRKKARYFTDVYYQIQEFRKAAANQVRSGEEEPNRVLDWVFDSMRRLEENIKKALGEFSSGYKVGAWLQSITGIGPVLSAGFLSHLDVRNAPTAGHFWRFCGLDPTAVWPSKADAKAAVQAVLVEERDLVFTAASAVKLYAKYAREPRPATAADEAAAERLIDKHGQALVRAVLPTLARCHNRDNLKGLQVKDFERQFQNAATFYRELCGSHEIIEAAEDSEPINFAQMRILADNFGRNPYNLFHAAQRKEGGAPTVDSTAAALCKRPWNATLKVLCYKLEDCFVKFQNNENDSYGKLYVERKLYETQRNDSGRNAHQARYILTGKCPVCHGGEESLDLNVPRLSAAPVLCRACHGHPVVNPKRFGADTDARRNYEGGKLPPAQLHARAMRWTGKLFLSHLHHVMHLDVHGIAPPKPFALEKLGYPHTHYREIPNWPGDFSGKSLADMAD